MTSKNSTTTLQDGMKQENVSHQNVLRPDGHALVGLAVQELFVVGLKVHEEVLHVGRRHHPRATDDLIRSYC